MTTEGDATEVVRSWRAAIKNKKRLIFSLSERAEIRLNTLKNQVYKQLLLLVDNCVPSAPCVAATVRSYSLRM